MAKKRFRTHANPLNFREEVSALDLHDICAEGQSLDFEIGFGRGVFMRHYAKHNPDRVIVGVEVRKPVALDVQKLIKEESVTNAHAYYGEGKLFLEQALPDQCLEKVFIFHPDPWFKKKHYKRRVVNEALLSLLIQRMKPKGRIYVSTDVAALWEDISEHFKNETDFKEIEEAPFWTKYYKTHWSLFSEKDERSCHCGTWEKS